MFGGVLSFPEGVFVGGGLAGGRAGGRAGAVRGAWAGGDLSFADAGRWWSQLVSVCQVRPASLLRAAIRLSSQERGSEGTSRVAQQVTAKLLAPQGDWHSCNGRVS